MASITNSKGFTVHVEANVPVGFSRKGVVVGNTVATVSGKGSFFGIGNVSNDDLRQFANDILASLPADEAVVEGSGVRPSPAKSKRAAKNVEHTEA